MCGDHTAKDLCRFAVVQHGLQFRAGFRLVFRQLAGDQHLYTQRHGHVEQARVAVFPRQELDGFTHFDRVTGAGGQYLVHVSEQRGGAHACAVGDANDRFGELGRKLIGRHKGTAAHLHVHHQRVQPFCQLFRQNRGGDQRNGVNGGGDVAGRVETLVCRGKRAGLADNCHTHVFNNVAEAVVIREDIEARNGFQFVERTAGVAQTAPGNHRDVTATGGHHRAQHQGGHVTHTAGGVFVHNRAVKVKAFPVQNGS